MRRLALRLFVPLLATPVFLAAGQHGPSPLAPDAGLPRVRLIATGGTIATRADGGRLSAAELVRSVPGLPRHVRPEWEQFSNVASTALSLDQWLQLARRINDLLVADPMLRGVVVTAGTDTLEELAYFLHLTVRSPRPVVLVGAMRAPDTPGYDGPANLLAAFRTAADGGAAGKGVLVVMNNEIDSARGVVKTDAQRLDAFRSPQYGALGTVDAERVRFTRAPIKRHTTASEFDVREIDGLPRVDVLLFYQGATPDLVEAAVRLGARGLVLAVAGADATAGTLGAGLRHAAARGVPTVLSTRTGSGRIASPAGSGAGAEYLAAEDLPPLKARILLALGLTRTGDPAELQRMFREY